MFSLEELFVSFIDQLSPRYAHGMRLMSLRSRRIQRSLRLIDATQGGCWTAPCSPAAPTFGGELSRLPVELVAGDACRARAQSSQNPAPLHSESEPPSVTAVRDDAQDLNHTFAVCGRGSSLFDSGQRSLTGSVSKPNTVSVSRASTSPLSSPPLSSASSSLLSSPTTISPPVGYSQERDLWARRLPPQLRPEATAQCTDLPHASDSDSAITGEAGEPLDPRHASSKEVSRSSPAADRHSILPPSSTETPVCERSDEGSTWTKKRLRSNSGQAVEIRHKQTVDHQISTPKTKRGTDKSASKVHQSSPILDRISREPLDALINQIGRTNTIADIQESVRQLKARPHLVRNPTEGLQRRNPIYSDTPAAQIIDATLNLAREIEYSTFNEELSRIHHRMALADFYCAYRAAHANPHVFLQELDRHPSQRTHRSRTRNRTQRAEVKDRFIQLVFCQSTSDRDHRKDSTRVNNWQKAGRPWLRDMKIADFARFLKLVEEREPVFRDALAAANNMMKEGFLDQTSPSETASSHPPNLLESPPSDLEIREGPSPVRPGHTHGSQVGDAYSGPDLDALLAYCFRLAAKDQQPKNILNQCHLWQSTRFDDLEALDEAANWFPRLRHGQQQPLRYQMLPFYNTARWQLAVFDIVNNVVVCYDTLWTSGLPNSTFRLLQQWFEFTLGSVHETLFECCHEKDTPMANTMKETIILTWWFARQFVDSNEVKGASVDWEMETLLANRILSNAGTIVDQTMDTSAEELISPSIRFDEGRDARMGDAARFDESLCP